MTQHQRLHRFFKEWREHRELSQDAAAFEVERIATEWSLDTNSRKIPTSRAAISRIETGDVDYAPVTLEILAAAYRCHPLALISRRPDMQPGLWETFSSLDARGRERLESYALGLKEQQSAA